MSNLKLGSFLESHPDVCLTNPCLNLIYFEKFAFFGLSILCGSFLASREPISALFSEDLNFGRPAFRTCMPRERFKTILRFLRFDDCSTKVERIGKDRLAPIGFGFETINRSFSSAYFPGTFITLD